MDPVTGGVIASIGSSLLGGLFGGGSSSKQEWITPDYKDIRKKAERAGFNPLTAMSMAAGGIGTTTTSGGWGQAIAGAAQGFSDGLTQKKQIELEETALEQRQRELDLREQSLKRQAMGTSRTLLPAMAIKGPEEQGSLYKLGERGPIKNITPKARPTADSEGYVTVFNPSGGATLLNKRQADRLKLSNFDMMMVEDFEALGGDEAGQLMALPHMPNIPAASFGGLNHKTTEKELETPVLDKEAYDEGTQEMREYLDNYDYSAGQLPPFGFAN